jgi:hypothetical protein
LISDYQYERLCWLIDNKDLDERDLRMISRLLSFNWPIEQQEWGVMQWLMKWLREKPSKLLPPWDDLGSVVE